MGQSAIPADLRTLVLHGTPASQYFSLGDTPQIVIGVPLPAEHAAYFEVFSLDELASTLRTLAFALAAAALVTTLAGAALGRWASGRALRPLAGVTDAAVAIAGGQLDTRVEAGDDVDLQELASAFNRMTANVQERIEREARFTSDVSHELRSPAHHPRRPPWAILDGHRHELSPGPAAPSTCSTATSSGSPGWWTTSSRSPGSTPARPSSPWTRWTPGSWFAGPWGPRPPSGEDGHRAPVVFPVEVGPGVEGLRLRVDKRRFERVMANLVENATLYAGGVTRVMVARHPEAEDVPRPAASGSSWRTRVPAFPRPSGTTSSNASTGAAGPARRESSEGTGLGLSLVAEHVRLHGGAIWIEDAPVRGSRFVDRTAAPSRRRRAEPIVTVGTRRLGVARRRAGARVAVVHRGLRHPHRRRADGHRQEGRALPPAQSGQPEHHPVHVPRRRWPCPS